MDPQAFKDSPAGQIISVGGDYSAFIPRPLPPPLSWTDDLISALSEADRALGQLAGLGRLLPNPHLLIRPFLHREAVLSSRIEGTQASLSDVFAYEANQPLLFELPSDTREVYNYVRALEYGMERLATLPLSLRLLREIHAVLMEGVRGASQTPGQFRDRQNWIGTPGCAARDAIFVPPPVSEMMAVLGDFERYLHAESHLPPLIRIGLIHYQFETIHPFLDGNGRIGRLLITLLLCAWDLLPQPLLYLSAYFERWRDAYIDLLYAVSQRGAWNAWLVFFLQGIAIQARDAVARAAPPGPARNLPGSDPDRSHRRPPAATGRFAVRPPHPDHTPGGGRAKIRLSNGPALRGATGQGRDTGRNHRQEPQSRLPRQPRHRGN